MPAFNKFNDFVLSLGKGEHDLITDTLKIYLTNNAPDAENDEDKVDLAGITEQNGYAPADVTNTWTRALGVATLVCVDVTFTASGGSFGPFQYVILFNEDHPNDGLIGWWDHGSSITVNNGEQFVTDFQAATFTLQ